MSVGSTSHHAYVHMFGNDKARVNNTIPHSADLSVQQRESVSKQQHNIVYVSSM